MVSLNWQDLKNRNVLFVASQGGHTKQAKTWSAVLNSKQASFVLFDGISRAYGENRLAFRYVSSRQVIPLIAEAINAFRVLSIIKPDLVISSGASPALLFFFATKFFKIPFVYIESISRVKSPSKTGKLLQLMRCPNLFSQYDYQLCHWRLAETTVFNSFSVVEINQTMAIKKAVVTLGTIRPFQFNRAINHISDLVPSDVELHWQVGDSLILPNRGVVQKFVDEETLRTWMVNADIVFCHAGIGSIFNSLEVGKIPFVLPRESQYLEHIDDHQLQISQLLEKEGLVKNAFAFDNWEDVQTANSITGLAKK